MSDAEAVTKPVEAVEAQPAEEKQVDQVDAAQTEANDEKPAAASETEAKDEKVAEKEDGAAEPKILKTTAQIDRENLRNNRKFDPSTREVTDDPAAIRKQVIAASLR